MKIWITVKRLDRSVKREENIIQTYMFSVGLYDIAIRELFLSVKASQNLYATIFWEEYDSSWMISRWYSEIYNDFASDTGTVTAD